MGILLKRIIAVLCMVLTLSCTSSIRLDLNQNADQYIKYATHGFNDVSKFNELWPMGFTSCLYDIVESSYPTDPLRVSAIFTKLRILRGDRAQVLRLLLWANEIVPEIRIELLTQWLCEGVEPLSRGAYPEEYLALHGQWANKLWSDKDLKNKERERKTKEILDNRTSYIDEFMQLTKCWNEEEKAKRREEINYVLDHFESEQKNRINERRFEDKIPYWDFFLEPLYYHDNLLHIVFPLEHGPFTDPLPASFEEMIKNADSIEIVVCTEDSSNKSEKKYESRRQYYINIPNPFIFPTKEQNKKLRNFYLMLYMIETDPNVREKILAPQLRIANTYYDHLSKDGKVILNTETDFIEDSIRCKMDKNEYNQRQSDYKNAVHQNEYKSLILNWEKGEQIIDSLL